MGVETGRKFTDVMKFNTNSRNAFVKYKGRFYVGIAGPFKFFVANPYEKTDFLIDGKKLDFKKQTTWLTDYTKVAEQTYEVGWHETEIEINMDKNVAVNVQKDKITVKDLENIMTTHEWLAGNYPNNNENPFSFTRDGNFDDLSNNHGGKWVMTITKNFVPVLTLTWSRGRAGTATFEFV